MGDILVTGFLPDGWADFAALLEAVVADGARLWRWEEASFADGRRTRAGFVVQTTGGPKLEAIRATSVARAQMEGWRFVRLDDGDESVFAKDGLALHVGTHPLPPRVGIRLDDRVARRGAAEYPAIVEPFRLAAAAGAAVLESVERSAELDLESLDRFGSPAVRARARGAYDAAALCAALARDGYAEDGDAWLRERPYGLVQVRLRDGAVAIEVDPRVGP
jgi:hypothetical protein